MKKIKSSEITPEGIYRSRREFLKSLGLVTGSALLLAACNPGGAPPAGTPGPTSNPTLAEQPYPPPGSETDELGNPLTPKDVAYNYTNYYDFTADKRAVTRVAADFPTEPWKVEVGGLVRTPRTFDLDDLRAFELEERIYRMRCVEAYSMIIPWMGFPLSRLLKEVEPTADARYVRFQTRYDPDEMPGQRRMSSFPWPYVEGLRLDEALHDLTILATGNYGEPLPPQKGAPVRLVVPWKYGFKSIKAVVKIDLVAEMPTSLWMAVNSTEYGFWANVNPKIDHRRWSQATERRIGENRRVETLFFNGYADEVADLYEDLDDGRWYY